MQLGLLLTYRCNARCRHCCVSAGPELTDVMNEADVLSYVDQAAAIPLGPAALCLSGGEVLLYWDLVERILRHARGKFETISLITNAFWATSPETARRKLAGLREAGLTTLVVSTSQFHSEFIKPTRVRTALVAADAIQLPAFVKCTAPADGAPVDQLLSAIGPIPSSVQVDDMVFLPGGRAAELPMAAFTLTRGIPQGTCPGAVLTLHPNGDAYFCCTPGAKSEPLKVGNALTSSIRDLVRSYYLRGTFAVLREQGPAGFVPAIQRAGLGDRLHDRYVDVCHLCTSLMSDPACRRVVEQVSAAREEATFAAVADRVITQLQAGAGGAGGEGVASTAV
jgi:hypothetical protein